MNNFKNKSFIDTGMFDRKKPLQSARSGYRQTSKDRYLEQKMLIKTPRLSIDSNEMDKYDMRKLKLQQLPPKSKIVR